MRIPPTPSKQNSLSPKAQTVFSRQNNGEFLLRYHTPVDSTKIEYLINYLTIITILFALALALIMAGKVI